MVRHLLLCVERMEVVVIGELSTAGDVLESKETDSVNSIHRPEGGKSQRGGMSECNIHTINFTFNHRAHKINSCYINSC